jgi:ferredoxin-NADP reductase
MALQHRQDSGLDLVVLRREEVADGVASFALGRSDRGDLPTWEPGAHIDVVIDGGNRQYSLTGSADDRTVWEIAVLREQDGRGGSRALFDTLQEGSQVRAGGPRNHFHFDRASHYRFVAGGIGITPIRAMIRAAEAAGSDWDLLYGGRTGSSMAYVEELRSSYGDKVLVRPQDRFGLLDIAGFLRAPSSKTLVYCCGPEPLLNAVERYCAAWPELALRLERFAPKVGAEEGPTSEFEVELVQTGLVVTVPADRSILEVAEEAGAFVTSSCEEGTCGSCETAVLGGEPDHRDSVLDKEQRALNDTMMICVSRCLGAKLVLDL